MPVTIKKENGIITVAISGDIDHHVAKEIRTQIDLEIDKSPLQCLEMDMSKCDFMDSSGLGLIMGRLRKCSQYKSDFKLINPAPKTMHILRMAGVDKLIKIENTDVTSGKE
ncbi:MAG: STAS domain-containing protein [Clostridia bacterium]|nr:STAS domain-containing protein [Clostridia bacterium]